MIKKYDRFSKADKAGDLGNYKKAYRLFSELAREGNVHGMGRLALMYSNGEYVKKQYKKSIYWDLEAIKQGEQPTNLAITYRQLGDIQRYKYYLEKAMAQGDDSATFDLAKLYSISPSERLQVQALLLLVVTRNNTIPIEMEQAEQILDRFEKEEKLENFTELFKSVKPVVKKIKYPSNYQKDSQKVVKQLAKVTEYLDRQKYKKARKLLEQLAADGCAKAMDILGGIYLYGVGVIVNITDAIKWYVRAIESGCFESNLNLAIAYRHTHDILRYKHYLELALTKGDDNAALLLAQLYSVSEHESERVEALLEQVVASEKVNADAIYQAEMMLKNLLSPFNKIKQPLI